MSDVFFVGEAGVTGALTSAAYGATVGKVYNKAKGLNGDINASLEKVSELEKKKSKMQGKGTLTPEAEAQIDKSIDANYKQVEAILSEADAKTKAKYMKSYSQSFGTLFDENGSYVGRSGDTMGLDGQYYSVSARGKEAEIVDDVNTLSENDGDEISVFSGDLSETAREGYSKTLQAVEGFNERSGENVGVVFVKSTKNKFNGAKLNGRIYLDVASLENGEWAGTVVHELTHFEEGTAEYEKLVSYLAEDGKLWAEADASILGDASYGFDINKLNDIAKRMEANEQISKEDYKYYNSYRSEVSARMSEYLLGNEAFIDKIINGSESLAKKVIDKIKALKQMFSGATDSASREQLRRIQKAEKLYLEAARAAGNGKLVRYILAQEDDEEESVDSEAEVQYNRNRTYKQISKQEYAIISSRIMEDNSKYMARDEELPKYAAARSADYFYVYENFAPGHFGVLKQIKITDANKQYITSIEKQLGENNGESVITSTNELNRMLEILKNQSRRNSSHNVNDSRGRADSGNGGISTQQSRSNATGNNGEGVENQRTVKKSSKIQHSYAGDKSATADMSLFERAEQMEADGAESEVIRRETGWFKSFDGQWRYEIDDSKMRYLNPTLDENGYTTLGELIEHDALFEAYPQLRDLKVEVKADTKYNYYSARLKKIVLMESVFENGDFRKSQDKNLSGKYILIHEIQHAIQRIEGFARGSSPSEWRQIIREHRKKVGSGIKEHTDRTIARLTEKYGEEIGQDVERYVELVLLDWKNKLNRSELEELDYLEIGLEMMLGKDFGRIENALIAEAKWIRSIKSIKGDAELNYYNTAGEIEAYDVGDRVDFDAEARRAVRPDIDRNPDDVKFADQTKWKKMHGEEKKSFKLSESDTQAYLKAGNRQNRKKQNAFAKGEKIILTSDEEIISYINATINGAKNFTTVAFGRVFDRLVNDVKTDSKGKIDISNFYLEFVPNDIRHAYEQHLTKKQDGDIDLTIKDFESIAEYIYSYDELLYAMQYQSGHTSVCLSKKTNKGVVIIILTVSKSRAAVQFKNLIGVSEGKYVSEYVEKYKKRSSTNARGSQSSNISLRDATAYNNIISQNSEKSTPETKKSKKIQHSYSGGSNAVSGAELMRRLDIGSDLSLSNADSDARRQRNLLQAEHFPGMSDEQVVKAIRNMTRKKVYSHSDAIKVSEDIARLLIFEDDYGLLQGKGNLIEQIWTLYNASGRNVTREAALKIADSVLESAVLGNIYEVENLEPYMQTLEILRPYMHSLDLSEYREEIKHVYGNKNSLSLIWGKREGGVTPDMIADEIRGQGLSINSEAPADILFEVHELYTKARDTIKEATKRHFEDALPDDEREKLRNRLAKAVMDGYKRLGSYSAIERANNAHRAEVKKLEEDFAKEFKAMQLELTDKVRELRYKVQANDVKNSIIKAVEDIKKVKSDAFLNATKYENHIFRTSIERLSSITRVNFSTTVSRQVFADLRKWYSKENPMLYKEGLTEDEQVYSQRVADMLDTICSGEGEYTITQLKCISSVIGHFKKLMQDYDKAFIDGEYVDIAPMAEKFVEINKENAKREYSTFSPTYNIKIFLNNRLKFRE